MTNISNSEKITDIKNNDLSSSINNNDSFYSLELPKNHKILNRKHSRLYSGRNIYRKISKIQKSQKNANIKLDILLSIIKSKLLGEYDYNISHYELSFQKTNNVNDVQKEIKEKEDNDFNIKDDFSPIESIKKDPISSSNNEYKKKSNNIKNNNSIGNLKDIINDFILENKNGKNNSDFNDNENKDNNMINNGNENPEINEDINNNMIPDDYNIKQKIKKEDKTHHKNLRTFGEINSININSLLDYSFKNELNLNKYKFEANDINNNNISNGNEINDSNKINEIKTNGDKKEVEENVIIDNERIGNININEEINKKGENDGGVNADEEKEIENKLDISQSDKMSVNSLATNSSGKKSNHSSSRKIRGFNFRNKIEIKKYSQNKFTPSSSNNNYQKK
jgi:hypothetical protein